MTSDHSIALFLIDLALLVALGRYLGKLLARVHQPPVLGEILAGILVGPSLLGAVVPGIKESLFPAEAIQLLTSVGNVGLVLFVFLVGLGVDRSVVRVHLRAVAGVSTGSFLVPFAVGALLSVPLYDSHPIAGDGVIPQLPFALFIGTALSVTAFPVLSRILADQGLTDTPLGVMSISAAAILDLVGWILLAAVLVLLAGGGGVDLARTVLEFLAFGTILVLVMVPLLRRVARGTRESEEVEIDRLSIVVIAALACAGFTQLIGLHCVLGALMLGLVFPREGCEKFVSATREAISPLTSALLLPVYFAVSGMSVNLTALNGDGFLEIASITALATAAKVGGTVSGARWAGLSWRDGLPLGILMNTRGLIEVVVLNVGYSAGLLDEALYSELIMVALITTFMTGPTLRYLRYRLPGRLWVAAPVGSFNA